MNKIKMITKVIFILLLIFLVLNVFFTLMNYHHECAHDDNCPVCKLIHRISNNLYSYTPNVIVEIVLLLFISLVTVIFEDRLHNKKRNTLIGLKVRLND